MLAIGTLERVEIQRGFAETLNISATVISRLWHRYRDTGDAREQHTDQTVKSRLHEYGLQIRRPLSKIM